MTFEENARIGPSILPCPGRLQKKTPLQRRFTGVAGAFSALFNDRQALAERQNGHSILQVSASS